MSNYSLGKVIKYVEDKGFGFIRDVAKDYPNVYFHISKVRNGATLTEGSLVIYKYELGNKGFRATEVFSCFDDFQAVCEYAFDNNEESVIKALCKSQFRDIIGFLIDNMFKNNLESWNPINREKLLVVLLDYLEDNVQVPEPIILESIAELLPDKSKFPFYFSDLFAVYQEQPKFNPFKYVSFIKKYTEDVDSVMELEISEASRKPQFDSVQDDDEVYHCTAIDNFASILEHGLLSRLQLDNMSARYCDLADHNIIKGRKELNNYIPFHFITKTAFDLKFISKCNENCQRPVYIAIKKEMYRIRNSWQIKIIPTHPRSNMWRTSDVLTLEEGIQKIDWSSLNRTDWYANSKYEHESRQNRMAEYLIYAPTGIKVSDFAAIYIFRPDDKRELLHMARTEEEKRLLDSKIIWESQLFPYNARS